MNTFINGSLGVGIMLYCNIVNFFKTDDDKRFWSFVKPWPKTKPPGPNFNQVPISSKTQGARGPTTLGPTTRKLLSVKGSDNKTQRVKLTQIGPLKNLRWTARKTWVIHHVQGEHHHSCLLHDKQSSASRIDKFSAGRTKCRSPMLIICNMVLV